jgi:hypothetical protein
MSKDDKIYVDAGQPGDAEQWHWQANRLPDLARGGDGMASAAA